MKKILLVLTMLIGCALHGQEPECTTMWPYLFPEFQEGNVFLGKDAATKSLVNIHVLDSKLHYLDGNSIKEADPNLLVRVEIGDKVFMCVDHRMVRLLKVKESGFLGIMILGDFDALAETGGAYGSSSNSMAVNKLTSLDIGGVNNTNHMVLKENKENGRSLPLKKTYHLVVNGKSYPATQKGIEKELSEDQKALFKKFVKEHRIKWKNEASLFEVLDFFKPEQ